MEIFVQSIFVFAIFKYCLKAAFTGRFRTIVIYAIGASLWAFLLYPIVIKQEVNIIEQLLSNQTLVNNGAVLTTIEAIAGIMIAVYLLDDYFKVKEKRSKVLRVLKFVPGILFPFAIAYFELLFFKYRVGANFLFTALLYAIMVGGGIIGLALLIKYLIPQQSVKLELKMLINLAILVIGLLINSSVADYNISSVNYKISWEAMLIFFLIMTLTIVVGFFIPKIKKIFKNNIKQ